MQRVVIEGRCSACRRLLFEVSIEDGATTHDLSTVCVRCTRIKFNPYIPRISIRAIIQAPTED